MLRREPTVSLEVVGEEPSGVSSPDFSDAAVAGADLSRVQMSRAERFLVAALAGGYSVRQVAVLLGVAPSTVSRARARVARRLQEGPRFCAARDCGEALGPEMRSDARYCSDQCRYRSRRTVSATVSAVLPTPFTKGLL